MANVYSLCHEILCQAEQLTVKSSFRTLSNTFHSQNSLLRKTAKDWLQHLRLWLNKSHEITHKTCIEPRGYIDWTHFDSNHIFDRTLYTHFKDLASASTKVSNEEEEPKEKTMSTGDETRAEFKWLKLERENDRNYPVLQHNELLIKNYLAHSQHAHID